MNRHFEDAATCLNALRDALTYLGAVEMDERSLAALVDACEDTSTRSTQGLGLRLRRWLIRDSDLDLFRIAKDATLAMASSKFIIGDLSAAAATGLGLAILQLGLTAFRAGVLVSRPQAQLITVLKVFGQPVELEVLAATLSSIDSEEWSSVGVVEHELRALSGLPSRKGLLSIVQHTPHGLWFPTDV